MSECTINPTLSARQTASWRFVAGTKGKPPSNFWCSGFCKSKKIMKLGRCRMANTNCYETIAHSAFLHAPYSVRPGPKDQPLHQIRKDPGGRASKESVFHRQQCQCRCAQ